MRQIISGILIVYLLFLSANTCSDMELLDCVSGHDVESYSEIMPDDGHSHEDTCSPLCYCICCSSPITVEFQIIDLSYLSKGDTYPKISFRVLDKPTEPFQQPPEVI